MEIVASKIFKKYKGKTLVIEAFGVVDCVNAKTKRLQANNPNVLTYFFLWIKRQINGKQELKTRIKRRYFMANDQMKGVFKSYRCRLIPRYIIVDKMVKLSCTALLKQILTKLMKH
jgi:hypothetical protein